MQSGEIDRTIHKVGKRKPAIEGAASTSSAGSASLRSPSSIPFCCSTPSAQTTPTFTGADFAGTRTAVSRPSPMCSTGTVEHGDSLGNRGIISAGDVQWMTAGSGIVHQEMPKGDRKGQIAALG